MENHDEERSVTLFPCPYLGGQVELNEERVRHIAGRHPDFLPAYLEYIAPTLANPDRVQISPSDAQVRLFTRWYDDLDNYVVVAVVIRDETRYWIVTARFARELAKGDTEWERI